MSMMKWRQKAIRKIKRNMPRIKPPSAIKTVTNKTNQRSSTMKSPRRPQIPPIKPKRKCMMSAQSWLRTESGTNFHGIWWCRFEFEFKFSRRSLFLCSDFH